MANPAAIARAIAILWPLIEKLLKRRKTMATISIISLAASEIFPEYDLPLKTIAGLATGATALPVQRKKEGTK